MGNILDLDKNLTTSDGKKKNASTPTVAFLLSNFRVFIFKSTQLYLRHPFKLFKPIKYDTLFYLRIVDSHSRGANKGNMYSRNSIINNVLANNSLCVVYRSVKMNGFSALYDKVLPPLIANSISGTVLFSSYLTLNKLNPESVFFNGVFSGVANNLVNTPLENFYKNKIINNESTLIELHKNNKSLIKYVFANFTRQNIKSAYPPGIRNHLLSLVYLREGFSYGTYFSVFEKVNEKGKNVWNTLAAGMLATVSLQLLNYPLHRLETIVTNFGVENKKTLRKAFEALKLLEKKSVTRILYQGFLKNTLSYLPSMTTTLILLDYLRDVTRN